MFGILVPGRLPAVNFQRISETQFVIEVLDIDNINNVAVYMTGEMPFPSGYAGAVYLCITVGSEQRWIYLGKITNDQPSTIFKISNLTHETSHSAMQMFVGAFDDKHSHSRGLIGISVEPETNINALTPAVEAESALVQTSVDEFTRKMLEHFYNYASSFAKDAPDGRSYVPLTTLQTWFDSFKRRLEMNPSFWKSQ